MFLTFFFSEIKYAFKQPMIYIFLGLIALLVFGAVSSDSVIIGGVVGNIHKNSPHILTIYTTIMSVFGLLMATAFFNNAALRDYNNNFNEIIFSTPISKAGYFFGRFFGALILATIPILGVFIGAIIGTAIAPIAGWVDADRFGEFYLETFVNNYFLFILPNMFFAGAIIFAMATKWKSTIISFVGTLLIIMAYIIAGTLVSDLDNETIGALTDTLGSRAYGMDAKYYTPIEKNTLSPGFSGLILLNRLIWTSVGFLVLMISYFSFSFKEKSRRKKALNNQTTETQKPNEAFVFPVLNPQFTGKTEFLHFKSFFVTNFLSIGKNVTFIILFIFSAIILVANLIGGFEYFGLQSYPLTYKLVDIINNSSSIFVVIILVFFSGELIWRDRDCKINEVIDATPHTSFISLAAKSLSLVAITTLIHFFFIFCGVIFQLVNGFSRIELNVYFLNFLYTDLPTYIIWSGLMIFIQVLSFNKYVGYFISVIIIFISDIMLSIFDVESNMLSIGAGPRLVYSDMNSFGPGLLGSSWFNFYWILFSILCLLLAGAFWKRGISSSIKERMQLAKKQIPKSYKLAIMIVIVAWIGTAGFVYYNTQILNTYKTSDEGEELLVAYEKKYKKYEKAVLPKITDVNYFVDIFPYSRRVDVKAIMKLINASETPIDSLHYTIDDQWNSKFEIPNAKLVFEDKDLGYVIYKLDSALQPNEMLEVTLLSNYTTKGFENESSTSGVYKNGTFLNNFQIIPYLGYNAGVELNDKNTRKKYDLVTRIRTPKLEENCTAKCMVNYLTNGQSDYINIETVISTVKDQTAIAPGSLIKSWEVGERKYFHYKVDHPSQHFCNFISAKYEKAKREWNGIDIEVYYDKKHAVNVERMLDAVERSLDYYTKNFGPYMHKQCRIVEFPRYAQFAQAFPGTMPYSEAIGFVINLEDESENNVVDAVIAHEMAHQWWAHQVVGAEMQGGTMLSESFAEYSSLMTMKHIGNNAMKMREFLKYDHDRYLRGRSRETDNELPLYKVENQTHIHYGKGSVILYALQDYIGEEKVNTALRNFLEEYRYKEPPYPTSLDFLKHLNPQVPDSLKYLIKDWIKEITLYDNRVKNAEYEKLPNGKYLVSLDIESYKMKGDTIGNETQTAVNDWMDIGVFSDSDEKRLLFEKRVKVDKSEMTFVVEVDSLPVKAAIDPRRLLIDRVYKDNIKTVSEK